MQCGGAQSNGLRDVAGPPCPREEGAVELHRQVIRLVVERGHLNAQAPRGKGVIVLRGDTRGSRVQTCELELELSLPRGHKVRTARCGRVAHTLGNRGDSELEEGALARGQVVDGHTAHAVEGEQLVHHALLRLLALSRLRDACEALHAS